MGTAARRRPTANTTMSVFIFHHHRHRHQRWRAKQPTSSLWLPISWPTPLFYQIPLPQGEDPLYLAPFTIVSHSPSRARTPLAATVSRSTWSRRRITWCKAWPSDTRDRGPRWTVITTNMINNAVGVFKVQWPHHKTFPSSIEWHHGKNPVWLNSESEH